MESAPFDTPVFSIDSPNENQQSEVFLNAIWSTMNPDRKKFACCDEITILEQWII